MYEKFGHTLTYDHTPHHSSLELLIASIMNKYIGGYFMVDPGGSMHNCYAYEYVPCMQYCYKSGLPLVQQFELFSPTNWTHQHPCNVVSLFVLPSADEDEEEEEEAQKSVPSQSLQHQHSGFSLASVSFTIQQGQLTLSTAIADQAAAKVCAYGCVYV